MAYSFPLYNGAQIDGAKQDENGAYNGISGRTLTGPNWTRGENNNKINEAQYYDLDLCNKYHTSSRLKQFQMVTFYFQNSKKYGKTTLNGINSTPVFVRCQLPDKFTYSIGGEWGSPLKLSSNGIFNALMSEAGLSTSFGMDALKLWTNPKPLAIKLSIPIFDDVETNSNTNFQEALAVFSRAVLPEMSADSTIFMSTPGPSFSTILTSRQDINKKGEAVMTATRAPNDKAQQYNNGLRKWSDYKGKDLDRITVQIGGILLIDWAIITDIAVTYPNTKHQILHDWTQVKTSNRKVELLPQIAQLDIQIETVAGLTRTAFQNMLDLCTTVSTDEERITNNNKVEAEIYKDTSEILDYDAYGAPSVVAIKDGVYYKEMETDFKGNTTGKYTWKKE